MKVVIVRGNLRAGLHVVERSGGDNPNLPVLKNVLIETLDNKVKLTTTNLETAATALVPGKVIQSGKTTVPIALLVSVLANVQGERLNLELKNGKLEITTDNYRALIQGISAEDFPIIPTVKDDAHATEIDSGVLREAFQQVVVATQPLDFRPELSSVFVHCSLETLKFAATDSFRLAEKTLAGAQFSTAHTKPFQYLVPLKTTQELLRILATEKVMIHHDENQVLFKTSSFEFVSRLIEGVFPEYGSIIPTQFAAEVALPRNDLINALKLSGIFGAQLNEVRVRVSPKKKSIEVFAVNQALGENTYLLATKPKTLPQESHEVSFNWRYLTDGLKVLGGDEVLFQIGESGKPSLLKSLKDTSYFYIVMPLIK